MRIRDIKEGTRNKTKTYSDIYFYSNTYTVIHIQSPKSTIDIISMNSIRKVNKMLTYTFLK